MALKISEIGTTLSSIINETLVEVSEKSGSSYTTKKFDLKQLSESINSLTTAITALTSRLDELDASQIPYDGTVSGLNATNVQAAINIVAKNGSQIVFLRGWLNRVLKLKEEW
jgi:hypothetical protein